MSGPSIPSDRVPTRDELAEIALEFAAWSDLRRPGEGESRITVAVTDHVLVEVLLWESGKRSGFHDHGDVECAVAPCDGAVVNQSPTWGSLPESQEVNPGEVVVIPSGSPHEMSNKDPVNAAYTVNVYAPPMGPHQYVWGLAAGQPIIRARVPADQVRPYTYKEIKALAGL